MRKLAIALGVTAAVLLAGGLAFKADATTGDIIWIENHAAIDLIPNDANGVPTLPREQWSLSIPAGVTLASGRGQNGADGGLLYIDKADTSGITESGGRMPRRRFASVQATRAFGQRSAGSKKSSQGS